MPNVKITIACNLVKYKWILFLLLEYISELSKLLVNFNFLLDAGSFFVKINNVIYKYPIRYKQIFTIPTKIHL